MPTSADSFGEREFSMLVLIRPMRPESTVAQFF
jgi:hypothetical protein